MNEERAGGAESGWRSEGWGGVCRIRCFRDDRNSQLLGTASGVVMQVFANS